MFRIPATLVARPSIGRTLTQWQQFGLRIKVKREVQYSYREDCVEFKKKMKESRKEHRERFWDVQTQAENKWLQDFRKERAKKMRDDMDRWRTSICKVSGATKKKLDYLKEREQRLLATMKRQDINNLRNNINKKLMLDAMNLEQIQSWPTLGTLDMKIDADVILPQTILNCEEYQHKLMRLAMFAD